MKKLFLLVFVLLIFSVCFAPPIPQNVVRRFELTNWDWTTKGFWVAESLSRFNNGIFFPDSSKAMFGNTADNPDMSIYSDGTNPQIRWLDTDNRIGIELDAHNINFEDHIVPVIRFKSAVNGGVSYGTGIFARTLYIQDVGGTGDPSIILANPNFPTPMNSATMTFNSVTNDFILSNYAGKINFNSFHDMNFLDGKLYIDHSESYVGINTETPEAELDVNGTILIEGAGTGFFKDGSNNLCLYDVNADTITLIELSCPPMVYLAKTSQAEGNLNLSDGTTWNADKVLIKTIRIRTNATDWTAVIYPDDDFDEAGTFPSWTIMDEGNGNLDIAMDYAYWDFDLSKEFHIKMTDNISSNTFDVYITGYRLR